MTSRRPTPRAHPTEPDVETMRVPARGRYDEAARRERLAWIAERSDADLDALADMRLVADRLSRNVENAIGAIEVPVGLAGPLLFRGEAADGVVYAPYATTEGALVASASRGATCLTRADGVATRVTAQRMTRAPAFAFATPRLARRFAAWLADQLDALRAQVGQVSRHARLVSTEPVLNGALVHVVFTYETGDAAGQNMTTATTWHACQWMLAELTRLDLEPVRFVIESNLSSDKKVNAGGASAARGCAVIAECTIDDATLRQTLRVSAEELLEAHAILRSGSERVRMVGHNVNVANTVAAIFLATGQDVACVHESSVGHLDLRGDAERVHARLFLPGLALGTVGGGTHLPAQQALLRTMGCTGEGSVKRLAEIVGGFALALDLSTLAAICTGEFASAHERLGRNRPVTPIAEHDLTAAFLTPALRRAMGNEMVHVERVERIDVGDGASILGTLTGQRVRKAVGLHHRRLHHAGGSTEVVVKVKPLDAEVILIFQGLAATCGRRVAETHALYRAETGFTGTHLRELAVYAQTDPRFTRHAPGVFGLVRDDARETHALVLERLGDVRLMDSADDPGEWRAADIETALTGIGAVHAIWMGREAELLRQPWIGLPPSAPRMAAIRPLWDALAEFAAAEHPALVSSDDLREQRRLIASLPEWWARLEAMPRTLIHNDFNPRNLALRADDGASRLCAYDWELATVHVPQRDAAELLAFVLAADVEAPEVMHYVEAHRRAVAAAGAAVPDAARWREGFALALRDLLVNRMAIYLMGHSQRHYAFLERVMPTLRRLLALDLERR